MFDTDINWELVQFKYEVLGISLKTLAQEYQISEQLIKFNAQSWKQLPLGLDKPLDLKGFKSLDEILLKLGEQTSSHTKAFAILKQKFLGPKYVELETTLLHKAIQMASELESNDPGAARTLTSLTGVLSELLKNNPLLAPNGEAAVEGETKEWKVTFVDASTKKNEK